MTIPTTIPNLQEVAKSWKTKLDGCAHACQRGKDNIDTNREHLLIAYNQADNLVSESAQLAAGGYTAEVLGPVVGEQHGLDWTVYEADWNELRDVLFPALISVIKDNELDIVKGTIGGPGLFKLDHPLPVQVKTDITTALDSVLDKFA